MIFPDTLLELPVLSVYLVTDFITARRSEGKAASNVFVIGLDGVPLLPSRVLRMAEPFHPPEFVCEVFMLK